MKNNAEALHLTFLKEKKDYMRQNAFSQLWMLLS